MISDVDGKKKITLWVLKIYTSYNGMFHRYRYPITSTVIFTQLLTESDMITVDISLLVWSSNM